MSAKPDCRFCDSICGMRRFVTGEKSEYCFDNELVLFYRCPSCKQQRVYLIAGGTFPDCHVCCSTCNAARDSHSKKSHTLYLAWDHDSTMRFAGGTQW